MKTLELSLLVKQRLPTIDHWKRWLQHRSTGGRATDILLFDNLNAALNQFHERREHDRIGAAKVRIPGGKTIAAREVRYWLGPVQVRGNEIAEKCANKRVEGTRVTSDLVTSMIHLNRKAKEGPLKSWKQQGPTSDHGRSYRGALAANTTGPQGVPTRSRTACTIVQIMTAHANTNNYLSTVPTTNIPGGCKYGCHNWRPEHFLRYCLTQSSRVSHHLRLNNRKTSFWN